MKSELRSGWTLLAVMACPLLLAACAGKSPLAAPSSLGLACGDVQPVVSGEVDVSDTPPECGKGAVCLRGDDVAAGASTSPGMCTCRCDGPDDGEPFCACGDGFVCREEVRDLGIREDLTGSYCVPAG
jgi:hypothetical protein